MSDKTEVGNEAEFETAGAGPIGVRETRHRTLRSRVIAVVVILVGIAAILFAINRYQHRGYYTPADAGYVPGVSSSSGSQSPSTVAIQDSPSSLSTPSESIRASASASPSPKVSAKHSKPKKSTPPPRPVMPPAIMQISLDSQGITAPVISVSTAGGALDVPADPKYVGLWDGGARPGWNRGSIVIDGHVDSKDWGDGSFFKLDSTPMGSTVTLSYAGKSFRFKLVGRRVYVKGQGLPNDVFKMDMDLRIVLITCGGPFNAAKGSYEDNVVVYGVPI